jgi:hypothetical protein
MIFETLAPVQQAYNDLANARLDYALLNFTPLRDLIWIEWKIEVLLEQFLNEITETAYAAEVAYKMEGQ